MGITPVYDPASNAVTFIGSWPAGVSVHEFFYDNGVLYGLGVQAGVSVILQINTTNPDQSVVVVSNSPFLGGGGGTTNGTYTTQIIST